MWNIKNDISNSPTPWQQNSGCAIVEQKRTSFSASSQKCGTSIHPKSRKPLLVFEMESKRNNNTSPPFPHLTHRGNNLQI